MVVGDLPRSDIVYGLVIGSICEWKGMFRVALDAVGDMLKDGAARAAAIVRAKRGPGGLGGWPPIKRTHFFPSFFYGGLVCTSHPRKASPFPLPPLASSLTLSRPYPDPTILKETA